MSRLTAPAPASSLHVGRRLVCGGAPWSGWSRILPAASTLLLVCFVASCAKSPTGPDPKLSKVGAQVDFPEAWSHDGKLIAFRRGYSSNYGPPGIYLIGPDGGQPRFLYPANLFWPARLRFSPDDRTLLAIDSFVLRLIDVETGASWLPMYTNSAVTHAEWTQDGRKIFYFRVHYGVPDVPTDSSLLHVLDLDTGTDAPFTPEGQLLSLLDMRRGPDGRIAARAENLPYGDGIVLVDVETRRVSTVLDTQSYQLYGNLQWWVRRWRGTSELLFNTRGVQGWVIGSDGTGLRGFPTQWHFTSLMSPGGDIYVRGGIDPVTRVGVLELASVDDLSGASYRHLTRFSLPPVGSATASGLIDASTSDRDSKP